jgi:2-hydroxychromene-2-carboxylate isomerase
MESIDYYWSFRSHYCYLSIGRVMEIARTYPVRIRLRPVLPMIVRHPDFFSSMPSFGADRWAYIKHDTERTAERLGLSFAWPDPDPVIMDHGTATASLEQPHIKRLNRLGVAADIAGQGLEFAAAVSEVIFGGTKNWDQGQRLENALVAAGIDLAALEQSVALSVDAFDRQIEKNGAKLNAAGHWGVPTLVLRDEAFFGQDRLEDFRWRLEQRGIRPV